MNKQTSLWLDVMRFSAAFAVLLSHAKHLILPEIPSIFAIHAAEAVAIFFVMSGFVIRHTTKNNPKSSFEYILDRITRLYSVMIPAIVVTLVADSFGYSINSIFYDSQPFWDGEVNYLEIISVLSFTNEIYGIHSVPGSNEPFWSLGYEAIYYIAFSIVLTKFKLLTKIVLILLVGLLVGPWISAYGVLWVIGIYTYDAIGKNISISPKYEHAFNLCLILSPLLYPVFKLMVFPPFGSIMRINNFAHDSYQWLYYLIISMLVSMHILGVARTSMHFNFITKNEKMIRWVSGATFTFYLMHFPLLAAGAAISDKYGLNVWARVAIFIMIIVVLFVLSEVGERRKSFWRSIVGRSKVILNIY